MTHPLQITSAFDLTSSSKNDLENAIQKYFGKVPLLFVKDPTLLCGIELATLGHKVSWNISQYSSLMQESLCNH